jgi:hypothetical protein
MKYFAARHADVLVGFRAVHLVAGNAAGVRELGFAFCFCGLQDSS